MATASRRREEQEHHHQPQLGAVGQCGGLVRFEVTIACQYSAQWPIAQYDAAMISAGAAPIAAHAARAAQHAAGRCAERAEREGGIQPEERGFEQAVVFTRDRRSRQAAWPAAPLRGTCALPQRGQRAEHQQRGAAR